MVRMTVVVVLGLVCSLSAVPAAAAGPPVGFVRVAHFSPDGPEVDVYVDGARALSGVAYKAVSSYQPLPAGGHTVDVGAAGASTRVLTSRSLDVEAGSYQTVAVAGTMSRLTTAVLDDDAGAPGPAGAEVRAMQFALDVPAVDIAVRGGPVLFSSVTFPNATGYASFPVGSSDLEFRAAGTDQVLLTASGITVRAGMVESLAGVGGVGRPMEVVQIPDAAAAMAVGGADAGLGGMARPGRLAPGGPSIPLAALLMAAVTLWASRRRRA
jgi:hypothetical protein